MITGLETRASNAVERQLDRMIVASLRNAHNEAIRRYGQALRNLENAKLQDQNTLNYTLQLQRAEAILQQITDDMVRAGQVVLGHIENTKLLTYEQAYRWQASQLMRNNPIEARWGMYRRDVLRELLSQEQGSPFMLIAYDRFAGREARASMLPMFRQAFTEGVMLGEGTRELSKRIQQITNEKAWRARRIARTELNRVKNWGHRRAAQQARDEFGVDLTKRWLSATDERTRDMHEAISGTTISMEDYFIMGNGDRMQFPGDPAGSAENIINCRCTHVYIWRR